MPVIRLGSIPRTVSALRRVAKRRRLGGLPTWRCCPATMAYLCVLVTTYWISMRLLPRDEALRLLLSISTNMNNLAHHPVRSLLGSALFPAPPLLSVSGVLTVGVGIAGCLGLVERVYGRWRAVGLAAAGHLGATCLTVPVVLFGVSSHRYDTAELHTFDFGVSYVAVAAMAAIVHRLPRVVRPLWLLSGVGYLLSDADWYGWLPDFTTIGHLCAVAIGLGASRGLRRIDRPGNEARSARTGEALGPGFPRDDVELERID
ncbi:rhomboid-like protein [Kitasatospora sp. NPDC093102]|uniref:rhomboid-like protein n=1 Tax=Kitasatospora sp. NPDC093102 TaxID=3155069 RepID=UPI00341C148B